MTSNHHKEQETLTHIHTHAHAHVHAHTHTHIHTLTLQHKRPNRAMAGLSQPLNLELTESLAVVSRHGDARRPRAGGCERRNKGREYPRGLQAQITNSANKQSGQTKARRPHIVWRLFMKEEIERR